MSAYTKIYSGTFLLLNDISEIKRAIFSRMPSYAMNLMVVCRFPSQFSHTLSMLHKTHDLTTWS